MDFNVHARVHRIIRNLKFPTQEPLLDRWRLYCKTRRKTPRFLRSKAVLARRPSSAYRFFSLIFSSSWPAVVLLPLLRPSFLTACTERNVNICGYPALCLHSVSGHDLRLRGLGDYILLPPVRILVVFYFALWHGAKHVLSRTLLRTSIPG